MLKRSFQNNNKIRNSIVITAVFIFCAVSFSLAQDSSKLPDDRKLSEVQKQARLYRQEGLKQQSMGNLDEAISFYQKAIELDTAYAAAYNDLGVIYEGYGWIDRAEESYLQALKFDRNFLSAYSNLAALYEDKQDLNKAYLFWKKRADLGLPDDLWTEKAKKKADELTQIIPELRESYLEKEAVALMKEAAEKKRIKMLEDIKQAKAHLEEAKKLYNKNDYKQAFDKLSLALSLSPQDQEILTMVDKTKTKLKEEEKETNMKNMERRFQDGLRYYRQDNLHAAKQEFDKIIELTAIPQKN